jgi:hypothetical protein
MIDPKAVEELRTQIADAEEHDDPAVSITFGCARALLTALAERERLRAVHDAAENAANFAWSSIKEIDCSEAADYLNELLGKLRTALLKAGASS